MILHLGVVDVPYVARETASQMKRRVKRGKPPAAGAKTTGDVADILEARYGIMRNFFDQHEKEIIGVLEEGIEGTIENLLAGAPAGMNVFGEGESRIKTLFSQFILSGEMEKLGVPGVPTKAALAGVSHRFKKKRSKERVSFVDTGLYESSFRAWMDL